MEAKPLDNKTFNAQNMKTHILKPNKNQYPIMKSTTHHIKPLIYIHFLLSYYKDDQYHEGAKYLKIHLWNDIKAKLLDTPTINAQNLKDPNA